MTTAKFYIIAIFRKFQNNKISLIKKLCKDLESEGSGERRLSQKVIQIKKDVKK